MDPFRRPTTTRAIALVTGAAFALTAPLVTISAAQAQPGDRDGDGMSNRWEKRHGLSPTVANARGDKDRDGLANIVEYRKRLNPADEDTDGDGHDDADEVKDRSRSTDPRDGDTDDDGVLDGDEDLDGDGIDNEDEDDARERCRYDDDDEDGDHVDDEDENELGLDESDSDTHDNGVEDGEEDFDEDGEANEDEDDDDLDTCGRDDGEDDEDLLGTIVSFDSSTGQLNISGATGRTLWFVVTEETEIEFDDGEEDGSTADLQPGVQVAEVDLEDDGTLEEIELYGPGGDVDPAWDER